MTHNTPNTDWLDEVLATIGVNGVDDNHVVGRAAAKQAILQHEQQAIVTARLNEAFSIGIKQEKSEYLPATYIIDRREELEATLTQQTNQGVSDE